MNTINKLENKIIEFKEKLTDAQKMAFLSAILLGLLAHGFALFNRLSVHDNSHCLFALGSTYEVNRWGLGIIEDIQKMTTKMWSLPLFNGFLSIVFIAIGAMILVKIFNVQSKLVSAIIGGLMVAFPMVTSSFSFMFTSWPYFLGLMIVISAGYYMTRGLSVKNFIIATLLLSFGISFYQTFLGVMITILLLDMFVKVVDDKYDSVIDYIKTGVIYLLNLGLGLAIWSVVAKAFRTIKHIPLLSYKGLSDSYDVAQFPNLLVNALKAFFSFRMGGINHLRYLRAFSMLIFVITVVMIVLLLWKSKSKLSIKIFSLVGLAFMPIGMVVVYLLSTSELYAVTTMMLYAEVFVYIIPLVLLQKIDGFEGKVSNFVAQGTSLLIILCTAVMTFGYVYLDNAAYVKASIMQEQAVVYSTALLANIKSAEGFSDDLEVVIVGFNNVQDKTINEVGAKEEMEGVQLEKYYNSLEEMINFGVNIQFLRDHIGIGNDKLRVEDPVNEEPVVSNMSEVKKMPCYPNEGSIAIIDDMLVVKMGELE
ncbi:MAG: glucosyltransferase domain-containing protein [Pseudobutyrivibrio sp.]|nr:glucosyltransferase domain-containing protein [Pseudobutyrivibrio sp.]